MSNHRLEVTAARNGLGSSRKFMVGQRPLSRGVRWLSNQRCFESDESKLLSALDAPKEPKPKGGFF